MSPFRFFEGCFPPQKKEVLVLHLRWEVLLYLEPPHEPVELVLIKERVAGTVCTLGLMIDDLLCQREVEWRKGERAQEDKADRTINSVLDFYEIEGILDETNSYLL